MLDPRFPAAIGRGQYALDDSPLNLPGSVGPGTLWPDATAQARTLSAHTPEMTMDWTLEVVVLPVSDIDGDLPSQREMAPSSMRGLQLVVADAEVARQELMGRGVECSEIQVFDTRDGGTLFGFSDPDGNTWAVQQLKVRGEKPLIPVEHRGRFGA
jgi:hypothetical protein